VTTLHIGEHSVFGSATGVHSAATGLFMRGKRHSVMIDEVAAVSLLTLETT
jgi:hypothetical protein